MGKDDFMKYELILPDGRRFLLHKEWIKIGRADDNDLVLNNSTVSRYHVNIYIKDQAVIVENAGSQSGFYINGEPIQDSKAIQHGDVLYLGSISLSFVRAGEVPVRKSSSPNKSSTQNDASESLYKMASKASQKSMGGGSLNVTRILMYGGLALVFGFLMFSEDTNQTSKTPSDGQDAPLAFGLKPLPADAYLKNSKALRSEDDVRAEGKYQEGLRDYYNQNYGRARVAFQEAMEFNPEHSKSIEYLAKTDTKMLESVNKSIRDAEQSFGLGQLKRAKWQAAAALSILSQQIPGYTRKLAQESDSEAIKRNLAQGQEESLLGIPCDQTLHKEKCKAALSILVESRRALGDEDVIRRYEQ